MLRAEGTPAGLAASVVVPVRNGGDGVHRLVEALEAQTLPRERFEVVLADDGSTDGATEGLASEDGWLRVLPGPPLNSYAARNRGARAARGAVLAFCDADCRPDPDWLRAGLAALEHADLVAGIVRFEPPARPTAWTLLGIDMFLDQAREVRAGRAVGANLLVRRSVFENAGLFDESLPSGGDFSLVRRCVVRGSRLGLAADAVVRHPTFDRPGELLGRVWRSNRCAAHRAGRARHGPQIFDRYLVVPPLVAVRARRRAARSFALDRRRLEDAGIRASRVLHLRALAILYLVLPWVAGVAQVRGWLDGRWAGRKGRAARDSAAPPADAVAVRR